ncbi:MAG: hypothetical protein WBO06_11640, partial [Gammaproteobacteria bacterium]
LTFRHRQAKRKRIAVAIEHAVHHFYAFAKNAAASCKKIAFLLHPRLFWFNLSYLLNLLRSF